MNVNILSQIVTKNISIYRYINGKNRLRNYNDQFNGIMNQKQKKKQNNANITLDVFLTRFFFLVVLSRYQSSV